MYKLIIADDEEKIREGIANLFPWSQMGFEIVGVFENGQEVINYISKDNPCDVVLTDISMPIMNGIELSSKLKDADIRTVFISSYKEFEYALSALQNRVSDYLIKPIKYQELSDCFYRIKKELDDQKNNQDGMNDSIQTYYGNIIQSVKKYVDNNYKDASLEEAAMNVSLSPSYLSKLFKQKTKENFTDYLMRVKMEKAKDLLQNSQYKMYQIAGMVGYDNPKNFSRSFKTYYHKTPQEYRQEYGEIE